MPRCVLDGVGTHSRRELVARVENAIAVEESRHATYAEDLRMWARREGARP